MTRLPLDLVTGIAGILAVIVVVLATIAVLAVRGESRANNRADRAEDRARRAEDHSARLVAQFAALAASAHDQAPRPLAAVIRNHRTKPLPRFVRHETPTRIDTRED